MHWGTATIRQNRGARAVCSVVHFRLLNSCWKFQIFEVLAKSRAYIIADLSSLLENFPLHPIPDYRLLCKHYSKRKRAVFAQLWSRKDLFSSDVFLGDVNFLALISHCLAKRPYVLMCVALESIFFLGEF